MLFQSAGLLRKFKPLLGWAGRARMGLVALGLSACVTDYSQVEVTRPADLPQFPAKVTTPRVQSANTTLARDFLDLTFALESGVRLPRLLKYDGPVRIALNNQGLTAYLPELTTLISRLRKEAGIDIGLANPGEPADIFIEAIPRKTINRVVPGAACFIEPGVRSWQEFRRPAGGISPRWSQQTRLGPTTIFIPSDNTPQETRDCLHEEIAQSLGPANDLYRLPHTIFNDDNFHSVLTPFDMLMLRTLYQPELQNGMTVFEVANLLPGILARLNPRGRTRAAQPVAAETQQWKKTITRAYDRNRSFAQRTRAAREAVDLASAMEPSDHRLGFALLTLARLETRNSPARALSLFEAADRQFVDQFGARNIRSAETAIHRALFALRAGDTKAAKRIAQTYKPVAFRAKNALIYSGLLAIEGAALGLEGAEAPARAARLQSLRWARYAFGDDSGRIARAQADIATATNER